MALATVEDAAKTLRVHPETIRRLLRRGQLQGRHIGRRWYLDPETLTVGQTNRAPAPAVSPQRVDDENSIPWKSPEHLPAPRIIGGL